MPNQEPQERFDRLLKAMTEGEPHKADKRPVEDQKVQKQKREH